MARPIEFEYDKVLENAMQQFWKEGYEASSVQKLLDATGINRGTLYNSFGDKDTFFKLCVDRYNDQVKKKIEESLANNKLDPAVAIEAYYKAAVITPTPKQRSLGCLLVNSVCESINWDKDLQKLIRNSLNNIRRAFLSRTKELEKSKKLKRGLKADSAAEILMGQLQGMYVSARNGRSPKNLETLLESSMAAILK
jgi:TetR/AcrR family transcriptional repressor of nem operon